MTKKESEYYFNCKTLAAWADGLFFGGRVVRVDLGVDESITYIYTAGSAETVHRARIRYTASGDPFIICTPARRRVHLGEMIRTF